VYTKCVAVCQDYFTLLAGTATIMAHEMGHNLGFRHDDELPGGCYCDDPGAHGKCIMNSRARSVVFTNSSKGNPFSTRRLHVAGLGVRVRVKVRVRVSKQRSCE